MEETARAVIPALISTVQTPADVQTTIPADAATTQTFAAAVTADPLTSLSLLRTQFAEPALPAHAPAVLSGTLVGTVADVTAADVITTADVATITIQEMKMPTLFLIQPAVRSQQAQSFPFAM